MTPSFAARKASATCASVNGLSVAFGLDVFAGLGSGSDVAFGVSPAMSRCHAV
jgi:hypothetical protein